MILYEHTHQAGETTDDKYIQVKPLYLTLFSSFERYFRQGKAFGWFRGLVFGLEEFLFWVQILDLDPDLFFLFEVFFFGPDFMFWSRLSFCTGFSFWCRLSFWTGFVYPTFCFFIFMFLVLILVFGAHYILGPDFEPTFIFWLYSKILSRFSFFWLMVGWVAEGGPVNTHKIPKRD